MEQISVSPVFVGRGKEQAVLAAALGRATAGQPQAVLIGGEAGIGKTRLIEEFLQAGCTDETLVSTLGGCLEVGAEGLPYAPLATALRRLHRQLGPELERAAEGMEGHLARLLPDFGPDDAEPNDEFSRARLFEHTTRLFERLTADRTLVLAIEDLHWSDRSTRELLAYLIRTLHHARVLIIASYRTDDLHRRHPLRPFLVELERLRTVHRLELDRFRRAEVEQQLAGILGPELDHELVDRIHRRSEGNPFFVEELAAAQQDGCRAGLTDSLRDILLVRVEALPDDTQRVLRIAAEGGSCVEHDLLAAVLDEGEEVLIEALRTAVGAAVLRPDTDGEGYCFRHALVREAISDDLLPGERHRINRHFATAVEQNPALVGQDARPARLANYWYHAHDPARALPTALDAARAARKRNAFAEQLRMLERALELWDDVPEDVQQRTLRPYDWAETYPPCACAPGTHGPACDRLQLVDVLAEAVVASRRSGDRERGLSLAKRALKLVDERTAPTRAAWFRTQRARMLAHLNRPGGDEEIRQAHRLIEGLPPSAVQADVLALSAAHALLRSPTEETVAVAERALEIARQVGAASVEQHARMTLGSLYADFGDPERGLEVLTDAVERTAPLGIADLHCRGINNLSSLLQSLGRSAEAAAMARRGLEQADANGLLGNIGGMLTANLAEALVALGRAEEAGQVLTGWLSRPHTDSDPGLLHRMRAELALLHGDLAEGAAGLARAVAAGFEDQPQHLLPNTALAVQIAAAEGRPLQARAELLAVLDSGLRLGPTGLLLPLLALGAATEADARGLPAAALGRPVVLARIAEAAARLAPKVPLHRGWARLLEGELARAEGRDAGAYWAAAIAELRPTGLPHPLSLALFRAAEAAAAAGEREAATVLLREAEQLAKTRGDRRLAADIARLAERAGLTLELTAAREPAPADPFGLTPRERDVLRLLAVGRTNRQIAEELYISPKTASVHVSNILAKLEVTGRTEAAALAHRLRLFPAEQLVLGLAQSS